MKGRAPAVVGTGKAAGVSLVWVSPFLSFLFCLFRCFGLVFFFFLIFVVVVFVFCSSVNSVLSSGSVLSLSLSLSLPPPTLSLSLSLSLSVSFCVCVRACVRASFLKTLSRSFFNLLTRCVRLLNPQGESAR